MRNSSIGNIPGFQDITLVMQKYYSNQSTHLYHASKNVDLFTTGFHAVMIKDYFFHPMSNFIMNFFCLLDAVVQRELIDIDKEVRRSYPLEIPSL